MIYSNTMAVQSMTCGPKSTLALSDKHHKYEPASICWQYQDREPLVFKGDLGYKPYHEDNPDQKRCAFSIWLYNEKPLDSNLKVAFGKGEDEGCHFDIHLNFKGWRTCWVLYDRDMEGAPIEGMDRMTLTPPEGSGRLYIAQMITASLIDPRHPTADNQVPLVNLGSKSNGHWLELLIFSREAPGGLRAHGTQTQQRIIEKRLNDYLLETYKDREMAFSTIKERFDAYDLKEVEGRVTGKSIDSAYYMDILPPKRRQSFRVDAQSMDMQATMELMLAMAVSYHGAMADADRESLKAMFVLMVKHLLDQGFAYGSSLGTVHHYGYVIRHVYNGVFLMRESLEEAGVLEEMRLALAWFSGLNRIFDWENPSSSNVDILNTLSQGMLATILMMADKEEKDLYLTRFGQWIGHCLSPAPGLLGTLKLDGSAFHHAGLYPAYALDGLKGITPVIYFIGRTAYRLPEEAHGLIRKSVLAMRLYSNHRNWLVSLSARHPKGEGQHTTLIPMPFKYMALSGSPDGKDEVDREMAAAYLRLLSPEERALEKSFEGMGITAEQAPEGHFTMNYGCLALHRRQEWLVGVRGHSRYLWSHESYESANLYGRYITYGQVQILSKGSPITNRASGFVTEGFDWNRWPGITAPILPFDRLKSDVRNVDIYTGYEEMLLSDETFAGGLNLEGRQGMFAMKVHGHGKYDGSHRLNLSVFMMDGRVICLGSDIVNEDGDHETVTNLFQNCWEEGETLLVAGNRVQEGPYKENLEKDSPVWLVDNKGNGYYVPGHQRLALKIEEQSSYAQDTCAPTSGTFASGMICHGKVPEGSGYEYAILVDATPEETEAFAARMTADPAYEVVRKDKAAHILRDKDLGITAYGLFEADEALHIDGLIGVDTPCMVMTRREADTLTLSLVDPDLRLYEGIEADQYDEEGHQKEVSVYSRTWQVNESMPSMVNVTLEGHWQLPEDRAGVSLCHEQGNTSLRCRCHHAMPVELVLRRR